MRKIISERKIALAKRPGSEEQRTLRDLNSNLQLANQELNDRQIASNNQQRGPFKRKRTPEQVFRFQALTRDG